MLALYKYKLTHKTISSKQSNYFKLSAVAPEPADVSAYRPSRYLSLHPCTCYGTSPIRLAHYWQIYPRTFLHQRKTWFHFHYARPTQNLLQNESIARLYGANFRSLWALPANHLQQLQQYCYQILLYKRCPCHQIYHFSTVLRKQAAHSNNKAVRSRLFSCAPRYPDNRHHRYK